MLRIWGLNLFTSIRWSPRILSIHFLMGIQILWLELWLCLSKLSHKLRAVWKIHLMGFSSIKLGLMGRIVRSRLGWIRSRLSYSKLEFKWIRFKWVFLMPSVSSRDTKFNSTIPPTQRCPLSRCTSATDQFQDMLLSHQDLCTSNRLQSVTLICNRS